MQQGKQQELKRCLRLNEMSITLWRTTAMKLGLALFVGAPRFRAIAGGALALMLVRLARRFSFFP